VPTASARLPGSDCVTQPNVDHLATVAGSLLAPETPGFERVRALKALLLTLLGSAAAEPPRPADRSLASPPVASLALPLAAGGGSWPG
jgi:hypothetical protein